MEIREDGFSYFTDYGYPSDVPRLTIEYKFKKLLDGNVEAYSRDMTSPLSVDVFKRLTTIIKENGEHNFVLKNFAITLGRHLEQSIVKVARVYTTKESRILNFNLRDDLRLTMTNNGLVMSQFINIAIAEKLERDGLL
jgi:hypothetical protein